MFKRTNSLKKSIELFFQYKSIDLFPSIGFHALLKHSENKRTNFF